MDFPGCEFVLLINEVLFITLPWPSFIGGMTTASSWLEWPHVVWIAKFRAHKTCVVDPKIRSAVRLHHIIQVNCAVL